MHPGSGRNILNLQKSIFLFILYLNGRGTQTVHCPNLHTSDPAVALWSYLAKISPQKTFILSTPLPCLSLSSSSVFVNAIVWLWLGWGGVPDSLVAPAAAAASSEAPLSEPDSAAAASATEPAADVIAAPAAIAAPPAASLPVPAPAATISDMDLFGGQSGHLQAYLSGKNGSSWCCLAVGLCTWIDNGIIWSRLADT